MLVLLRNALTYTKTHKKLYTIGMQCQLYMSACTSHIIQRWQFTTVKRQLANLNPQAVGTNAPTARVKQIV